MTYPELTLGTPFFTKQKSNDSDFEVRDTRVKPLGKNSIFTFRSFLKHAEMFLALITSSLEMFRER